MIVIQGRLQESSKEYKEYVLILACWNGINVITMDIKTVSIITSFQATQGATLFQLISVYDLSHFPYKIFIEQPDYDFSNIKNWL
jgi:hypothetical protein